MAEALTPSQLAAAQRRLDRGLTLHGIAAELGVPFEAICLGLFGGNKSTAASVSEPRLGKPTPRKDASRTVPQASHADTREAVTGPHRESGETNSGSTGGRQLQPALRTGVAPGAVDTHPVAKADDEAEAGAAGPRFRLVSERGEALHHNERVLTRLPKFFWRGDADEVRALKRRKPQWARLKAVAVLS